MIRQAARNAQELTGFVIVFLFFIVVPVGVWVVAAPMISELPFTPDIRRLLTLSVLTTVVFGGASAFLVYKGMRDEP